MPSLIRCETTAGAVSAPFLEMLLERIDNLTDPFGSRLDRPEYNLTAREKEICNLVRGGASSKEIAAALNISVHTVNTHRKQIRRKLGIGDRFSLEKGLNMLK